MKALTEIADIHPRMTSIHDSSLLTIALQWTSSIMATKLSIVQCISTSATSTRQLTSQKAKVEVVAIPRIGDVRRTKMR